MLSLLDIFLLFGIPLAFGAIFGFAFGFVPSRIVHWTVTIVVGGGVLWVLKSTIDVAQGIIVGFPVFLVGFGFVAALWLTVGIRSHCRNRAVQKKAPT